MSATAHSPTGSHNEQDQQPYEPSHHPTRVPRTHVNATAVDSFKALSLKARLRVCKEFEGQNDARLERTCLNTSDPSNHPELGSETASLFSLDDGDLDKLKHPSFAALFRDVMPTYIANWLFDQNQRLVYCEATLYGWEQFEAMCCRCLCGASVHSAAL